MPFKDIEPFEKYIEAIHEHYDGESTIIQEADIFIEIVKKIFKNVKLNDKGKGINESEERFLDIKVEIVIYLENE